VTGVLRRRGRAGLIAAAAVVLDRLAGDPPDRWHPVAWFGSAMERREAAAWSDEYRAGIRHLAVGLAVAVAPVALAEVAVRRLGSVAATAAATVVVATTLGARSLDRRAAEVANALGRGHLEAARAALPALVGRDPAGLDEAEISRAVVESLAENTVDAVVAPLWWAVVAGPLGAVAYRAVNTLDAMVGYRNDRYRRFGWASARTDDVVNFLPARLTALLVAACSPRRAGEVTRAVRHQAPGHPSPNAGVAEAAFAAALGLRLGGVNRYGSVVEQRVTLGEGRPPAVADIERARRLARRVWAAAAVAATLTGLAGRAGEGS
jgi:adenosylcobinamide-phosphate synthase